MILSIGILANISSGIVQPYIFYKLKDLFNKFAVGTPVSIMKDEAKNFGITLIITGTIIWIL